MATDDRPQPDPTDDDREPTRPLDPPAGPPLDEPRADLSASAEPEALDPDALDAEATDRSEAEEAVEEVPAAPGSGESVEPHAEPVIPDERADPEPHATPLRPPGGLMPVRSDHPPAPKPVSLRRIALAFLGMVVVGLGSLWLLDSLTEEPVSGDLITFAVDAEEAITQFRDVPNAGAVQDQLMRRLGWRVRVPEIRDTPLKGVGFAEIMTGISVPVLMYDEASGGDLAVTIVNYVFLDTHEGVLRIEPEALRGIEREEAFVVRKSRDQDVLIWRSGDEIFLASGESSGEELAARIARGRR